MGLPLFYWCPRFSAFLAFPKLLPAFILVLLNVRLWEPLLTAGTFLGLLTTFKMLGEPLLEKPLFALGTRSHPSGRANNFLWQLRTFWKMTLQPYKTMNHLVIAIETSGSRLSEAVVAEESKLLEDVFGSNPWFSALNWSKLERTERWRVEQFPLVFEDTLQDAFQYAQGNEITLGCNTDTGLADPWSFDRGRKYLYLGNTSINNIY